MAEYTPEFKPVLRYVDAIPSEYQGQPVLLLRDPLGFVEELVLVPQSMAFVLSLMDGEHDLRDIQTQATKQFGTLIPMEEIVNVVKFLDEKGLLWSENFEKIKEKAYEKWFSYPFKPMAHAGQAYPPEKDQAEEFLNELLGVAQVEEEECPKVLVVPHIDLRAGAEAYAKGYKRFKPVEGSRIILIGVGHHLDLPYSVLTKDIATPFGMVKNDKGGVFYLSQSKKVELFPDHIAHKLEHSLEFQCLFLGHLLKDGFVVLPILMGPILAVKHDPKIMDSFAHALADLIDEQTYVILAIDFCHLGLRYGDRFEVTEAHVNQALDLDKKLFQGVTQNTPEEFLELAEQTFSMKVCGITCLYLLNQIFKYLNVSPEGKIFHQEAIPFGKGSIVSVMAAGWYF